ncbi:MAG: inositol monophosphatase family protein [Micromonosporaceae bacterium]
MLDPVDGTANLVHGLPLFAVSLALVDGKRPVFGVIDLPLLGSRYAAVEGQGARVDGQPIQVSNTANLTDAIVTIGAGAQKKNDIGWLSPPCSPDRCNGSGCSAPPPSTSPGSPTAAPMRP